MKGGVVIRTLTLRLDDELHKQFKLYSVHKEKDMQKILTEYIEEITGYENHQQTKEPIEIK